MATIKLVDGREVPVVKPHIGDQMELERQMRASDKKYGAAQFVEDMKLGSFQTAFALFASFRRADVPTTIHEILELDLETLSEVVTLDRGDDGDESVSESEGEQTADPQHAQMGDENTDQ